MWIPVMTLDQNNQMKNKSEEVKSCIIKTFINKKKSFKL